MNDSKSKCLYLGQMEIYNDFCGFFFSLPLFRLIYSLFCNNIYAANRLFLTEQCKADKESP